MRVSEIGLDIVDALRMCETLTHEFDLEAIRNTVPVSHASVGQLRTLTEALGDTGLDRELRLALSEVIDRHADATVTDHER